MDRITREDLFMTIALQMSKRSTCLRAQVGCIIVDDKNRILSSGYAGSPSGQPHCLDVGCEINELGGCKRTIHAETNAIVYAAKIGISIDNGILFTSMSPCYKCAQLIYSAGLTEVVYFEKYRDSSGLEFLEKLGVHCYLHG